MVASVSNCWRGASAGSCKFQRAVTGPRGGGGGGGDGGGSGGGYQLHCIAKGPFRKTLHICITQNHSLLSKRHVLLLSTLCIIMFVLHVQYVL